MAESPVPRLEFAPGCPDCGERKVDLPAPLPPLGDDFDWAQRDYDGFRLFMMEELAARFPERTRWTPADMEVVLVECLAVALDLQSDYLDRIASEAYLETARRPESVYRLLRLIGFDALEHAGFSYHPEDAESVRTAARNLMSLWRQEPRLMEEARRQGPREIHTQKRMVTEGDYSGQLEDHPLVLRAHAFSRWTGSWSTVFLAAICRGNAFLDQPVSACAANPAALAAIRGEVDAFNAHHGLAKAAWDVDPTLRAVLRPYIEARRMAGQEVILVDAEPAGVDISVSLRVGPDYYQSEIRQSALAALGSGLGGFFEPGRLRFGEDLHAGDIIQTLMALEGVESACLNRFKRVGGRYPDQAATGIIRLEGLQVAVCDNARGRPERGSLRLVLHGGKKG